MTISESFDWENTVNYEFRITNESSRVIEVRSVDNAIVYHRGYYIEDDSGFYKINLNLPATVTQVSVNGEITELSSSSIIVDLSLKNTPTDFTLVFNGTSSYVNARDVNELDGTSAFTIEAWAVVGDWNIPGNPQRIYEKGNSNVALSLIAHGNHLTFYVGSIIVRTATLNPNLGNGQCFHFATVFDGTQTGDANRLKFYINGIQQTLDFNNPVPTTTPDLGSEPLYFGKGLVGFLKGGLDEIRVWNVARTADEITDNIYNSMLGREPGLVAYYQCNDGSGFGLKDKTLNYPALFVDGSWTSNGCISSTYWLDRDYDGIHDDQDDFPDDPLKAYINHWPATDTGTLVFEDNYPRKGDFDFNDLVLGYKFKTITDAYNKIVEINSYFKLRAYGTQKNLGFGFQLPELSTLFANNIDVQGCNHESGIVSVNSYGFEEGQTKPTIIAIDNIADVMNVYSNTSVGGSKSNEVTINVNLFPLNAIIYPPDIQIETWNPFAFINNDRTCELHKPNFAPTDLCDNSLFNTYDDASVPLENKFYITKRNLPWVLDLPSDFAYPIEGVDIIKAYQNFKAWAESDGLSYTDWFSNLSTNYRNSDYLYSP